MNIADSPASKVAFVFEGGGSLAATQIGMLRALTEARLRRQLVIGSSAGAINALAFAADPTAAGVAELKPCGFGYTGAICSDDDRPVATRLLVPEAWLLVPTGLCGLAAGGVERLSGCFEERGRIDEQTAGGGCVTFGVGEVGAGLEQGGLPRGSLP